MVYFMCCFHLKWLPSVMPSSLVELTTWEGWGAIKNFLTSGSVEVHNHGLDVVVVDPIVVFPVM